MLKGKSPSSGEGNKVDMLEQKVRGKKKKKEETREQEIKTSRPRKRELVS